MTRYPIVVCVTIALHLLWSIGLIIDPNVIHATGLHTVLIIAKTPGAASIIFGAVGILAIIGLISSRRFVRVFFILPQQAVLWFSVVGAANAMLLGQFADGVQRTHWFLIVDQVPVVLIALGHTAALLLMAGKGHG